MTIRERVENAGVYTGDLVMPLRSNRTKVDNLVVRLHWPILVARPLNCWPNPNVKMYTLPLITFHSLETDEQVVDCGYGWSVFIFKPLSVIEVHFFGYSLQCS
jgi:hypothetical protein